MSPAGRCFIVRETELGSGAWWRSRLGVFQARAVHTGAGREERERGPSWRCGAPGTHWQAVALVPSPVCYFQLLCRLSETSFAQTLPGQSQHFSLLSGSRPPGVRRRYWLRGGRECGQGQGLQRSPLNLVENRPGRGALSYGGGENLVTEPTFLFALAARKLGNTSGPTLENFYTLTFLVCV